MNVFGARRTHVAPSIHGGTLFGVFLPLLQFLNHKYEDETRDEKGQCEYRSEPQKHSITCKSIRSLASGSEASLVLHDCLTGLARPLFRREHLKVAYLVGAAALGRRGAMPKRGASSSHGRSDYG